MNKFLGLLVLLSAGTSAYAQDALLSVTSYSAPSPEQKKTVCAIYADHVDQTTTVRGAVTAQSTSPNVIWTNNITADTIDDSIATAADGTIENYSAMVAPGCGMQEYDAGSTVLFGQCGDTVTEQDVSTATRDLIYFINGNCFIPSVGGAASGSN